MENKITITLNMAEAKKATVKFVEPVANEYVPEKLGTLYLNKVILAENSYNGKPITIEITKGADPDGIVFMPEKCTKTTVKFNEKVENQFCPAVIGDLYIPKYTLAELAYAGEPISLNILFED